MNNQQYIKNSYNPKWHTEIDRYRNIPFQLTNRNEFRDGIQNIAGNHILLSLFLNFYFRFELLHGGFNNLLQQKFWVWLLVLGNGYLWEGTFLCSD